LKIKSLAVAGYKSIKNSKIEVGGLNVFAGPNSSGKSSVLQVLLLLRQSADKGGDIGSLKLSGDLYEAGTADDILHPAAEHKIAIGIESELEVSNLRFYYNRDADKKMKRILEGENRVNLPKAIVGDGNSFAYLNAERRGPRLLYPLPPEEIQLVGLVGKFGEFTAAVLARAANGEGQMIDGWGPEILVRLSNAARMLDRKEIEEDLRNTGGRLDLVCNVIFGWIIPGATFKVEENEQTDNASLRYGRQVLSSTATTRATHSGFGLTYTLPIIAAALGMNTAGLFIVENPEAHLPPFSQSRIGVFLAIMASFNRQIFVETHSDHVINGIRLAAKHEFVDPKEIYLNFFNKNSTDDASEIVKITVLSSGRLSKWPEGFFDQIENDLSRL
jgi:predicted ATPase